MKIRNKIVCFSHKDLELYNKSMDTFIKNNCSTFQLSKKMSEIQKDRKTERQKNRKTERQKDRKTERQKDRKTERQKDRKSESQKDINFASSVGHI